VKNGVMGAVNHDGGVWLSIVCNHGMDDDTQLLVGGMLWIRCTSLVAIGMGRSEL
jgi:hypothetical protein